MNHRDISKLLGLAALAAGLSTAAVVGDARAQAFPEQNVTLVVPWPAGGGQDVVGRLVAEYLDQELPTSVVVTNVPGAAGANGVREVEEAAKDGYTIGTMGVHVIAQSYINPNATDVNNIDPLVLVNTNPAAISVRADTGIESLGELVEYLKANPGALVNGNDSPGGFSFLTVELIEDTLGVEFTKVPYQGYAPTVAALVSGEVMSATLPVPVVAELHRQGDVRILAVAAEERNFAAPDVPTFKELGYDFVFADNVMIFGPTDLPGDVKQALETALLDAMASEGFKTAGATAGLTLNPLGSEAANAVFRGTDESIYPIMLDAGLVQVRRR